MNCIRLLPVFFAFLLIAAHFMRANQATIALICILVPGLLLFTRPWSVRTVQVALLLAALEWIRTAVIFVQWRMEAGAGWMRLALILGGVALFTGLCPLIFQHGSLRRRYMGLDHTSPKPNTQ